MDDELVMTVQLGRAPRSRIGVARRCHLGLPVVTIAPPRLEDGEPFPTRFWLTCPLARRWVSRLEAAGGVRDAAAHVAADPERTAALARAHRQYAEERDRHLEGGDGMPHPSGGVGGAARGIKCLHAHLAHRWAGYPNPVGDWVLERTGEPDCVRPCVMRGDDGQPVSNPAWQEGV